MPKPEKPKKKEKSVKPLIGKKPVDKTSIGKKQPTTVSYKDACSKIITFIRFFLNKPIIQHTGSSIAGFCQLSGCQELLNSKTKKEAIEKTSHDCPTGIQCYGICDLWDRTIKDDPEAQDKLWEAIKILQLHREKLLKERVIVTENGLFDLDTNTEITDEEFSSLSKGGKTKKSRKSKNKTRRRKIEQ
jgi:hypothetical protein